MSTPPAPVPPGREAERIRDIPRSCPCTYAWLPALLRWQRADTAPGCPWHGPGRSAP